VDIPKWRTFSCSVFLTPTVLHLLNKYIRDNYFFVLSTQNAQRVYSCFYGFCKHLGEKMMMKAKEFWAQGNAP
jgi:hypothetical protein